MSWTMNGKGQERLNKLGGIDQSLHGCEEGSMSLRWA